MFVVCFKTYIRKVLSKIRRESLAKIIAINYCDISSFWNSSFCRWNISLYSLTNVSFWFLQMDNAHVLILFILSLTVITVTCQSYHFSIPDWANEKKNILEEIINRINKYVSQSNNVLANCELQKLKLLLQGSINNQVRTETKKKRELFRDEITRKILKPWYIPVFG